MIARDSRSAALAPIAQGPVRWFGLAAASPARNMAIDRALLYAARTPAIRIYAWSPPGVSLGWFQRDLDTDAFENAGFQVVRRLTGGGAVAHHHEVTYAAVLPLAHPLIAGLSVVESYRAIHAPIREALRSLGIDSSDGTSTDGRKGPEPELCFERSSSFDILVGGRKAVGSAQRRLPDRLLQHGSIVLEPNALQPDQPSLSTVVGRPVTAASVAAALETAFAALLGVMVQGELTAEEEALAASEAPPVDGPAGRGR